MGQVCMCKGLPSGRDGSPKMGSPAEKKFGKEWGWKKLSVWPSFLLNDVLMIFPTSPFSPFDFSIWLLMWILSWALPRRGFTEEHYKQAARGPGPAAPSWIGFPLASTQAPWATAPSSPSFPGPALPVDAGWDAQDIAPALHFATCIIAKFILHRSIFCTPSQLLLLFFKKVYLCW